MRQISLVAALLAATVMLISISGCASTPSESASRIQVISADDAKQYQYIGRVQGSSALTGMARETGYHNAMNNMLANAAAKGADFVVVDDNGGPSYWTVSEIVSGAAYKRKL
jgi:hypothetical protein